MKQEMYQDSVTGMYVKPSEVKNRFLVGFVKKDGTIVWDDPVIDSDWDVIDRCIPREENI